MTTVRAGKVYLTTETQLDKIKEFLEALRSFVCVLADADTATNVEICLRELGYIAEDIEGQLMANTLTTEQDGRTLAYYSLADEAKRWR